MSKNITTPAFRVSYPNLFKPKLNTLSKKEEFAVTALFKKGEDLSQLKKAAQEALETKFGPDKTKWPKNIRTPFRDQAEKKQEKEGVEFLPAGHEDGAIYLNLKSSQRPGVVDQNVQAILDETQLYPGCWARATVRAYAYDQAGNRGVSFGLVNVQKVRDDDPLGGRMKAEDEFAPIAGANEGLTGTDLFV
jgi:hypothetical protein